MAEVQKTTVSGETTQKFIQFILMQQQQTLLALGRYPNPPPGLPPSNLTLARVFIDQLEMIRVKTAGNLNGDEEKVLNSALVSLEAAYRELTNGEA